MIVSTPTRPPLMRHTRSANEGGAGAPSETEVMAMLARRHLLEALGVARGIALHGLDQHVAADRAGGGAARHAVLDDDGAGIARIGDGAPADEQRVVAQVPGQR